MKRLLIIVFAVIASLAFPASAGAVACHVVTDRAGDGVRTIGATCVATPNEPALDVLSADVGIGVRTLVFVVRVANLGDAIAQGPQTYQWQMYFHLRGKSFLTNATRAPDGSDYYVRGDIRTEQATAPGFMPSVPVSGAFDVARSEIRVNVPRS